MRRPLRLLLLTCGFIGVAQAAIACQLAARQVGAADYAPDTPAGRSVEIEVSVVDDGDACRNRAIVLQGIGNGLQPRDASGHRLLLDFDAGDFDRRGDALVLHDRQRERLRRNGVVRVSLAGTRRDQYVPVGQYLTDLRLVVDSEGQENLQVGLSVLPAARFFYGQPRSVAIDFGEPQAGEKLTSDVMYQANADFSIALRSENDGRLEHVDMNEARGIPYSVRVAGSPAATDGRPLRLSSPSKRRPNGRGTFSVDFILGRVDGLYSGAYRDRVTLSITAF